MCFPNDGRPHNFYVMHGMKYYRTGLKFSCNYNGIDLIDVNEENATLAAIEYDRKASLENHFGQIFDKHYRQNIEAQLKMVMSDILEIKKTLQAVKASWVAEKIVSPRLVKPNNRNG